MKKFFIIPLTLLTIISSASFAKSDGAFVGLNILHSSADMVFQDTSSNPPFVVNGDDSSIGYGVNAGYAFSLNDVVKNIDGLYVAPNGYFNFNQTEVTFSAQGISQVSELDYSYGLNIDIGYDINEKFSVYAIAGYTEFRVNNGAASDGSTTAEFDSSQSLLYGLGLGYNLDDRLSLRLAYETFSQDVVDGAQSFTRDLDVDTFKFGVAYNF